MRWAQRQGQIVEVFSESNVDLDIIYKTQKALEMTSKLTIYDSQSSKNGGLGQGGSGMKDQVKARKVGKGLNLGLK